MTSAFTSVVSTAVVKFEASAGPIELLANVAGLGLACLVSHTDRAFWDKVIGIKLYGPPNLHHVVVKRGGTRLRPCRQQILGCWCVGSSREAVGGIIAFTKTVARERARKNIILNVVCPGPTDMET